MNANKTCSANFTASGGAAVSVVAVVEQVVVAAADVL
jgi:hypothetical protein